jgi:hypothetical protein
MDGRKFSARKKNMKDMFGEPAPTDWSWRMDFVPLIAEVANGSPILNVILVGSIPPRNNDSLFELANQCKFNIETCEPTFGQETDIVDVVPFIRASLKSVRIMSNYPEPGILKLVSRYENLNPLIASAHEESWETELWGFSPSISHYLAESVMRVKTLDEVFEKLGVSD